MVENGEKVTTIKFKNKIKRRWWQFWKPREVTIVHVWKVDELDVADFIYLRTPIIFKKEEDDEE